jgi:MinD-like ATPase involved in chromosome partitioning or flagellar assembly
MQTVDGLPSDAMATADGGRQTAPNGRDPGAVHVTVRFAERQVEADVDAERPVAELVPQLLGVVFGADDAAVASQIAWVLSLGGGEPLPGSATLRGLGVNAGAVLRLDPVDEWQPAAALPPGALPPALVTEAGGPVSADDFLLPRQRTRAALPERQGLARRVAGAIAALAPAASAGAPPPAALPAPGTFVPPARLMVPHRTSPVERSRRRWRDSGYEHRLERMIQAPHLTRCVTIAVMSPKGGVGKTTVSVLLGTLFALLRRDRIVAVDTNPDFGSLGRSLAPGHDVFVDDLLEVLDSPELTVTALDANLGRAVHGLMVLPVPSDPARMARLDQTAYTRVIRRLQDLVGMVLLDCGTGLHDATARAALETADQVLLVTDGDPSTASLVAEAAALLRQQSVPTWLVVNRMTAASRLELASLEAFVPYARGLLVLPEDRPGAGRVAAGAFDWRDAPAGWKASVREIAAVLVAAWHDQGLGG